MSHKQQHSWQVSFSEWSTPPWCGSGSPSGPDIVVGQQSQDVVSLDFHFQTSPTAQWWTRLGSMVNRDYTVVGLIMVEETVRFRHASILRKSLMAWDCLLAGSCLPLGPLREKLWPGNESPKIGGRRIVRLLNLSPQSNPCFISFWADAVMTNTTRLRLLFLINLVHHIGIHQPLSSSLW